MRSCSRRRGRRPKIEGDREVRSFVDDALVSQSFVEAAHAARVRFGSPRAPSKSAVHRYWHRSAGDAKRWLHRRGRRGPIARDAELRAFIDELLRSPLTLGEIAKRAAQRFGPERAPTEGAVYGYWLMMTRRREENVMTAMSMLQVKSTLDQHRNDALCGVYKALAMFQAIQRVPDPLPLAAAGEDICKLMLKSVEEIERLVSALPSELDMGAATLNALASAATHLASASAGKRALTLGAHAADTVLTLRIRRDVHDFLSERRRRRDQDRPSLG